MEATLKITLTVFFTVFLLQNHGADAAVGLRSIQDDWNQIQGLLKANPSDCNIFIVTKKMADRINLELNIEAGSESPEPINIVGKVPKAELKIQFEALIAMVHQNPKSFASAYLAKSIVDAIYYYLTEPTIESVSSQVKEGIDIYLEGATKGKGGKKRL